jgi:hypothetical protein
MIIGVVLVAAGFVLLAGFVLGSRLTEANLEARERRLARQRRDLQAASMAQRRAAAELRERAIGELPEEPFSMDHLEKRALRKQRRKQ